MGGSRDSLPLTPHPFVPASSHSPISMDLPQFSLEEIALLTDEEFFRNKAAISKKIRNLLHHLHAGLQEDLHTMSLITPTGFDPARCQFVKGEHLEEFPYQYLDFPKHFLAGDTWTFRALIWWGHHMVFALLLEGEGLLKYKHNMMNRFHSIAGQGLSLCLSPSLWEWKQGEGMTLPITHDKKSEIAASISERYSLKIARFVSFQETGGEGRQIVEIGRRTFQSLLPIVTP